MKKRDWQILGVIALVALILYYSFKPKTVASAPTISERPQTLATINPNDVDGDGKPMKK